MEKIIGQIEAIVNEAEYMRNAYFWSPPSVAFLRRDYEKKHSHDEVAWTEGGHDYTADYSVMCSCRNIYASGRYTRDGEKTNLTAVKNSLKRLKEKYKAED